MRQRCLVLNTAEVALVCLRPKDGMVEMELRACRAVSTCPACGTASRRVHSRYRRKFADLPWEGLPVVILLHARKFIYVEDRCRRKVFTERLPGTVGRYARRSCRSSDGSPSLWEGGLERGWHAGSGCWPADQRCSVSSIIEPLLLHLSQRHACLGSTTGHGRRATATARSSAIWGSARWSICCPIVRPRP